ncbi:MAG: hypothetical protein IT477_10320 [Rhodanobacteraceae bacterium]|nr:hypothetical protein [Rhodanobacteraceae bacterium]
MHTRIYAPDNTVFTLAMPPLLRLGPSPKEADIYIAPQEGPPVVVEDRGGVLRFRNRGAVPLPYLILGGAWANAAPQQWIVLRPQQGVKLYQGGLLDLFPGSTTFKYRAHAHELKSADKITPCAIDKVAMAGNEAMLAIADNPNLGDAYAARLAQSRWFPFWARLNYNPNLGNGMKGYLGYFFDPSPGGFTTYP